MSDGGVCAGCAARRLRDVERRDLGNDSRAQNVSAGEQDLVVLHARDLVAREKVQEPVLVLDS
jgi:hypothetical protein